MRTLRVMAKQEVIELAKARYEHCLELLDKGAVPAAGSYAQVGIFGLLIEWADNFGGSGGEPDYDVLDSVR